MFSYIKKMPVIVQLILLFAVFLTFLTIIVTLFDRMDEDPASCEYIDFRKVNICYSALEGGLVVEVENRGGASIEYLVVDTMNFERDVESSISPRSSIREVIEMEDDPVEVSVTPSLGGNTCTDETITVEDIGGC